MDLTEATQGWCVLIDGETRTPTTLLDGTELAGLRTAAVSAVGWRCSRRMSWAPPSSSAADRRHSGT